MTYNIGEILLSKFKVDEWLGGGTYTQVLRVVRLNTHEVRTLKLVRQGAAGLDSTRLAWLKARFQLEANLVEQVGSLRSHPNLLEVFGYHDLDGLPILERQFASRGSLADLLESARYAGKRLLLMKTLKIALETADGLAALHNREIIHRDLKPSNILIDVYHNVRISDLYLAQIPSGLGLALPSGSPSQFLNNSTYLSPEQMRSKSPLTPPSDVYALGAMLFEMLTGSNYNTLTPGTRLISLRPDVPEWLDDLLSRMVAREPEKRPWSGAIVSALLRAGLDSMDGDVESVHDEWENWETVNPAKRGSGQAGKGAGQSLEAEEALAAFPGVGAAKEAEQLRGLKLWISYFQKLIRNPAFWLVMIIMLIVLAWLLTNVLVK